MANKKKIATTVVALTTAAALLLGGTFAWQSISQTALNEASDVINPGGRLHNDLWYVDAKTTNNDIYVENFTDPDADGDDIYARVRLSEYMEIVMNYGTAAEKVETVAGSKLDGEGNAVTDKATDNTSGYEYDYTIHYFGEENATDEYWEWDTNGADAEATYYMPTFNKNKDSLAPDLNGLYRDRVGGISDREAAQYHTALDDTAVPTPYEVGDSETAFAIYDGDPNDIDELTDAGVNAVMLAEYIVNETGVINYPDNILQTSEDHEAKPVGTTSGLVSMEWWLNEVGYDAATGEAVNYNAADHGNYWVYDTDGWVYWSGAIGAGETTGLLLDSFTLKEVMDDTWYYAIEAEGEFVTADDLGEFDSAATAATFNLRNTPVASPSDLPYYTGGTGFYENGISKEALALLSVIGVGAESSDEDEGVVDGETPELVDGFTIKGDYGDRLYCKDDVFTFESRRPTYATIWFETELVANKHMVGTEDYTTTWELTADSLFAETVDNTTSLYTDDTKTSLLASMDLSEGALAFTEDYETASSYDWTQFACTIKATTEYDGEPYEHTVSFRIITPNNYALSLDKTLALPGDTVQATFTVNDAPSEATVWSVEGGVAGTTIDENGLLTIAADQPDGVLTVTAEHNGYTKSADVYVNTEEITVSLALYSEREDDFCRVNSNAALKVTVMAGETDISEYVTAEIAVIEQPEGATTTINYEEAWESGAMIPRVGADTVGNYTVQAKVGEATDTLELVFDYDWTYEIVYSADGIDTSDLTGGDAFIKQSASNLVFSMQRKEYRYTEEDGYKWIEEKLDEVTYSLEGLGSIDAQTGAYTADALPEGAFTSGPVVISAQYTDWRGNVKTATGTAYLYNDTYHEFHNSQGGGGSSSEGSYMVSQMHFNCIGEHDDKYAEYTCMLVEIEVNEEITYPFGTLWLVPDKITGSSDAVRAGVESGAFAVCPYYNKGYTSYALANLTDAVTVPVSASGDTWTEDTGDLVVTDNSDNTVTVKFKTFAPGEAPSSKRYTVTNGSETFTVLYHPSAVTVKQSTAPDVTIARNSTVTLNAESNGVFYVEETAETTWFVSWTDEIEGYTSVQFVGTLPIEVGEGQNFEPGTDYSVTVRHEDIGGNWIDLFFRVVVE